MEFEIWHYWLMAAIVLAALEIVIPSFIVINFAVGALLTTIFAAFNASIEWQIAIFAVGSLASFFIVRPFMLKWGFKKSANIKTNVDAMIGKIGKVTEQINIEKNTGRVMLDGDDWRAKTEDDSIIEKDLLVEVLKVDSIVLYVKPKQN